MGGAHLGQFVDDQGIEDDDLAGPQRRHKHLVDAGEKRRIVGGAVEDGRRGETQFEMTVCSASVHTACSRAAAPRTAP